MLEIAGGIILAWLAIFVGIPVLAGIYIWLIGGD